MISSKSPRKVAKVALAAGKEAFSDYSHLYSPHKFTQPQLFACLVLKEFENQDYRGIWQMLIDQEDLRQVIGLKSVPHFTTLQKASRRLLVKPKVRRLIENTVRRINKRRRHVVQLVHGIALFPALKLGKPGEYTLNASDANGDTMATSNGIEITGLHIAFAEGGAIKEAGADVPLVYKVELEDFRDRLVNNSSLGLQLTLTSDNDASSGVLSGIADNFSAGMADNSTYPRVAIDKPGSYTLTFTVLSEGINPLPYEIKSLTTKVFQVLSNHLDFVSKPLATGPNLPLKYDIQVRDYLNKVVNTNSGDTLSFSLIKDTSLLGPAGTYHLK